MNFLIDPTITVNEAVPNKCYGYTIILEKQNPNYLLIKARSANGRGRGNVGKILRDGTIEVNTKSFPDFERLLNKRMRRKIDTALDLVYGVNRTNKVEFNKNKLVTFKNVKS